MYFSYVYNQENSFPSSPLEVHWTPSKKPFRTFLQRSARHLKIHSTPLWNCFEPFESLALLFTAYKLLTKSSVCHQTTTKWFSIKYFSIQFKLFNCKMTSRFRNYAFPSHYYSALFWYIFMHFLNVCMRSCQFIGWISRVKSNRFSHELDVGWWDGVVERKYGRKVLFDYNSMSLMMIMIWFLCVFLCFPFL